MKRTAIILVAVFGLLAAACTKEATTDASGQLGSDAATETGSDASGQSGDDSDDADGADTGDDADDGDDADGTDDGGDADGTDDADAALQQGDTLRSAVLGRALDRTDAITAASFEGVVTIVGGPNSELPGELTLVFQGAFDADADATRVTLDMSELFTAAAAADPDSEGMGDLFGSMFDEPMEMITIGDKSWIKWGLLALFSPGNEDKWLESDAESGSAATDFGFGTGSDSPTGMLEELADANADVTEIGSEDIRGVSTTHYRAELDTEAMAATMSPDERAEFETDLGASPDASYVIDLWIDDEDLLHRFVVSISGIEQVDETDFEAMTMTYDLWDHGADQGIVAPPADQIITEDEFGFDLEDLGGLGG